jgi:hypothetical protein
MAATMTAAAKRTCVLPRAKKPRAQCTGIRNNKTGQKVGESRELETGTVHNIPGRDQVRDVWIVLYVVRREKFMTFGSAETYIIVAAVLRVH